MKRFFLIAGSLLLVTGCLAQTVTQKLQKAFRQFENDPQLKYAVSSLYVIDAKTGKPVFDKNSKIGLAPASTQKVITSVTAFELLGKDYRYKTEFGYEGTINGNAVNGSLVVVGNGDPTFGSWRWENTKPGNILASFVNSLVKKKVSFIRDSWSLGTLHFEDNFIPGGWIWEDVGNYYGAGFSAINWKENQFDVYLRSGSSIGSLVEVIDSNYLNSFLVRSEARAAAKGSGDNAYAYLPIGNNNQIIVRGTIPINEKRFQIAATIPDPPNEFFKQVVDALSARKIEFGFKDGRKSLMENGDEIKKRPETGILYTHYSPTLDSIIYWFNKKSINLYGEALIRTLAYGKNGFGSIDGGIAIVKDFWKQKGIDENELNINDGSGLSPQNRVTTHSQVEVLKYAKGRSWFPFFYNSLPEYNGMRMKSGTIRDVKGYCGYHKSSNGSEYIFSFLVNNYNGPSSGLVSKMFKVLDVLK